MIQKEVDKNKDFASAKEEYINFKGKDQMDNKNNFFFNTKDNSFLTSPKEEKLKIVINKLGRKTKRDSDEGEGKHSKFSDDNLIRKSKHLALKYTLKFINEAIKKVYNGNIGKGLIKKELKTINQSQKINLNVNYNKMFLDKTLEKIFSEDITNKLTCIPHNYNRILISYLMNEKDGEKKSYFVKLFNVNFRQCLNHFIQKEKIEELDGLTHFEEIKNDFLIKYPKDGEEYCNLLSYYLNNFEKIINNKRPRKSRKKK